MINPVLALCEQQRLRSACAHAVWSEVPRLLLAFVAELGWFMSYPAAIFRRLSNKEVLVYGLWRVDNLPVAGPQRCFPYVTTGLSSLSIAGILPSRRYNIKWAASWQNQQNDCASSKDWADAQADLSLRWLHMPLCWFCDEAAQMSYVRRRGSLVFYGDLSNILGGARPCVCLVPYATDEQAHPSLHCLAINSSILHFFFKG